MKIKFNILAILLCLWASFLYADYHTLKMCIELRDYELDSLFAIRSSFGKRFMDNAPEFESIDPLAAGDKKLKAGNNADALAEYRKLLVFDQSPTVWQGQFNSMIANRRLGRYVDALLNCNALIDSDKVPDRIKAYAQRNAAIIAFYDLSYDSVVTKYTDAIKANTQAPLAFVEQIDKLLEELRIKRYTKLLSESEQKILDQILPHIRKDHPRMFFNKDTFPLLLEYLKRPNVQQYYQQVIKTTASKITDEPRIWNGEVGQGLKDGQPRIDLPKPTIFGIDSAKCALIYLVEGDPVFFNKAKRLLKLSGQAALLSFDCGVMAGDYYSIEIMNALMAYDWLYNDLSPSDREEIIKPLLEYVYRCRTESHKFISGESLPHEGGFYGTQMLKWYAGIASVGDGIDEQIALKLLYEGYREHEIMLDIREIHTSDDGGFISVANNYVLYTYPWTSFNYLETFESATGKRSDKVKHLEYLPQWVVWSSINGTERKYPNGKVVNTYDFGVGDTGNTGLKESADVSINMYELTHNLYGNKKTVDTATSLITKDPFYWAVRWPAAKRPLAPLLCFRSSELPDKFADNLPVPQEHARFFEELGIIYMRSGSARNDTYACFVTNKKYMGHRHYDANHFMIYKYDFLAIDTGTRIGWTRGDNEHLNNYYAQSVAHNTILIHQPKEPLPNYWGTRKEDLYYNHGGQNSTIGDICAAYETNDLFTYIASDATATYSHEKCKLALRQFVFIYPDIFVIADRVETTKPQYSKEFLMHTQNKPSLQDDRTWYADDGGGRMFCRTLLPKNMLRGVVGGEGKDFWASGKNWELPQEAKQYAEAKNYLGQYRVEVSPENQSKSDMFLQIIQVSNDKLPKMIDAKTIDSETFFGCEFEYNHGAWKLSFAKSGNAAGHISFVKDDIIVLDCQLTEQIQQQGGLNISN